MNPLFEQGKKAIAEFDANKEKTLSGAMMTIGRLDMILTLLIQLESEKDKEREKFVTAMDHQVSIESDVKKRSYHRKSKPDTLPITNTRIRTDSDIAERGYENKP